MVNVSIIILEIPSVSFPECSTERSWGIFSDLEESETKIVYISKNKINSKSLITGKNSIVLNCTMLVLAHVSLIQTYF